MPFARFQPLARRGRAAGGRGRLSAAAAVTAVTAALGAGGFVVALPGGPAGAANAADDALSQEMAAKPWTFLGPKPLMQQSNGGMLRAVSGRITSVVVDPTNAQTVYAGTAGAGVWKSTDGGATWSSLTPNQASLAIGALAIDPTGKVIYAGTGEINGSDSQFGQGILKSDDGGQTWTLLGQSLFAREYIGGLVVDRANSEHVLAATSKGLYSSDDGGDNWTRSQSLAALMKATKPKKKASGQVFEVHQDPSNPSVFVASFGDACETEQAGIAVSDTDGTSWKVTFSPEGMGRIGVGLGPGGVDYAAGYTCSNGGFDVLKSEDHAENWNVIPGVTPGLFNFYSGSSKSEDPQAQGDYDNAVAVDPTNADNAVFGGVSAMATTDGGASFSNIGKVYTGGYIHPDFHAFAFFAPNSFYIGNDGGMWSTTDMGGTGRPADYADLNAGLPTIQFNTGSALNLTSLLGGTQDNGSPGFFDLAGTALPTMTDYSSGDGGATAIDPTPGSDTIYVSYPHLDIARGSSLTPLQNTSVPPCRDGTKDPACAQRARFYAPYVMDMSNPERLLGGQRDQVFETLNGGGAAGGPKSWKPISPDVSGDGSIISLAIGPKGGKRLYSDSNEADVWRTMNGTTWTNITGNLPPRSSGKTFAANYPYSNQVIFNPAKNAEAWVAISSPTQGHGGVWHTMNAGAAGGPTWADLKGSGATALPNVPVLSIAEDPVDTHVIYAGTASGAWVCVRCGGKSPEPSWRRLGAGFPNVQVDSLTVSADGKDLLAWTHGWGVWALPTG